MSHFEPIPVITPQTSPISRISSLSSGSSHDEIDLFDLETSTNELGLESVDPLDPNHQLNILIASQQPKIRDVDEYFTISGIISLTIAPFTQGLFDSYCRALSWLGRVGCPRLYWRLGRIGSFSRTWRQTGRPNTSQEMVNLRPILGPDPIPFMFKSRVPSSFRVRINKKYHRQYRVTMPDTSSLQ